MDVALMRVQIKRLLAVTSLVFVVGSGRLIPQTSHDSGAAKYGSQQSSISLIPTGDVHRATLDNGMRVIVIRNPLAPVVTVEQNFIVGGNETPPGFPGMAHAQEHMAFRGCYGLTADQTAAIFAQLGGFGNADTQQHITQYFSTIPSADLEIALRVDSACMRGMDDSQQEWTQEKGAIEQEVARDLSNPTYTFLTRLNQNMFAGTVYAHDALGTIESFEATTGELLKKFYSQWYAPNNAVLVIAGDVQPDALIAKVKELYGTIPRKQLPPRPQIKLSPVISESFTLESNLPYLLVFIAYRMPGTDSPEFAAASILADVLGSQRGNLYGMVPQGKALQTQFDLEETYRKASVALSAAVLPAGADAAPAIAEMRKILGAYAANGVRPDLVEAAKRRVIARAQFRHNSIPGLADAWSEAVAGRGLDSPDEDVERAKRVTVQDVNRIAKQYLLDANSITAILKPVPSGEAVQQTGFGGTEQLTSTPSKPVELPPWASSQLLELKLPSPFPMPVDTVLPNGIRLIVRQETITPTVTVRGSVRHNGQVQEPQGKEGISEVLDELFSYGTKTLDRLAFQEALDDIAAEESGGFEFSLKVLKEKFSRGMQLLADNEMNPALPADAFTVTQQQFAQFVAGRKKSPGSRTERALAAGLLPANDPGLREPTQQTVASLSLDDVRSYYLKTMRPDLTTIVVIGDVTPDEAHAVVEKWFGPWTAEGARPDVDLPVVPPNKPSAASIQDPTQFQDSVTLSQMVPINRFDQDYYPLQLGNHVLGGGFYATRLYHDLRQTTGYVYSIDVRLAAKKTRATYTVTFACDPKNTEKAHELIQRDLIAMQKEEVTATELQQAKALLLRQIPLSESSQDSIATGFLARAEIGLQLNEPEREAKIYFGLTANQVRAAFAKWIRPDGFVQIVLGPGTQ